MKLILHTPNNEGSLRKLYLQAFSEATELFLLTAFLTDWHKELKLSKACKAFRLIVGRDFGITKKAACREVLKWLPTERKSDFLVVDRVRGFHPKLMFWKKADGSCFAIVGSSNLTVAAFETNYEANAHFRITDVEYREARKWIRRIEKQSVPVSEDWLEMYNEMPPGSETNNLAKRVESPRRVLW